MFQNLTYKELYFSDICGKVSNNFYSD